jgi:hypothetical protein
MEEEDGAWREAHGSTGARRHEQPPHPFPVRPVPVRSAHPQCSVAGINAAAQRPQVAPTLLRDLGDHLVLRVTSGAGTSSDADGEIPQEQPPVLPETPHITRRARRSQRSRRRVGDLRPWRDQAVFFREPAQADRPVAACPVGRASGKPGASVPRTRRSPKPAASPPPGGRPAAGWPASRPRHAPAGCCAQSAAPGRHRRSPGSGSARRGGTARTPAPVPPG